MASAAVSARAPRPGGVMRATLVRVWHGGCYAMALPRRPQPISAAAFHYFLMSPRTWAISLAPSESPSCNGDPGNAKPEQRQR